MKHSTSRVVFCGIATALSMIFSYVEFLVPFNFGVPGIKLGLSNIVVIVLFYVLNPCCAAIVGLLKVFLSGLLFGTILSTAFSLAGFFLSFLALFLLQRFNACHNAVFSVVGISVVCACFHTFGQLLTAAAFTDLSLLMFYLPIIEAASVVAGLVTGYLAKVLIERISYNDWLC